MNDEINFLWLDSELGEIELISLKSFHKLGYRCILWTYDDIINLPKYVELYSANDIIERFEICNRKFSDYFRYKLLYSFGGWWSDIDNICLKPLPEQPYFFYKVGNTLNNNILKVEKESKLMLELIKFIENDNFNSFANFDVLDGYIREYKLNQYICKEDIEFGIDDLILKEIDWNYDNILIHLFKSNISKSFFTNDNYKNNIKQLKNILYE